MTSSQNLTRLGDAGSWRLCVPLAHVPRSPTVLHFFIRARIGLLGGRGAGGISSNTLDMIFADRLQQTDATIPPGNTLNEHQVIVAVDFQTVFFRENADFRAVEKCDPPIQRGWHGSIWLCTPSLRKRNPVLNRATFVFIGVS